MDPLPVLSLFLDLDREVGRPRAPGLDLDLDLSLDLEIGRPRAPGLDMDLDLDLDGCVPSNKASSSSTSAIYAFHSRSRRPAAVDERRLRIQTSSSGVFVLRQYPMVSLCLVTIAVTLSYCVVQWLSIPRVDDDLATEVILGVKHDDGSELPPIFGHRGGGLDAPENTLAAFREAKNNHASGIKFELSFTWDNVAVIFHDETLERTTDGRGPVADVRFDELRRLDAASKHPFAQRFKGERVPTLEEGVEECLRLGMRLIIEVKEHDCRAVEVLDQLFRERPVLYGRALVASSYPNFVYALRRNNPDIVTALTWRPGILTYEDANNTLPRFESRAVHLIATAADWLLEKALHVGLLTHVTGVSAVLISANVLSVNYVHAWRNRGVHVIAWTPNHPAEKQFLRSSIRVPIITDTVSQD
nr:glycerophosphodiester phosphodiesterase 1-like [Dermacentor andersoni]